MAGPGERSGDPGGAADYRRYLELTTEGIWRYEVRPAVRASGPARKQAEAILERSALIECNSAFARLHGVDRPEDMVGLPLTKLLAGSHEDQVQFVASSIESGYRIVDVESATRDRQGRTVWTLNNVIGDVRRGNLVGGWGSSRDITERKAATAALHEAHAGLRATLAALPDLVFEVDGDGRIHDFHARRTEELFVPPAQFLGKRVDEVLPTHAAAIILGALREVVRKGSHGRAKYALDMPSGRRWYDLVIAPKGETRGAAARYLVIARDVTEREQVTAALQASEQRLALALNAASDGVYNVDLRTGEAYYSPGYYTMLGFEPGEFAPSDAAWESLLHPDDRERALAMLDRCVSGDVDEAETEFRLRTKTGEWRRIVSRGRIVARDEHARAIRLVGTHRDVTAESEAREEIRRERDLAQAYLDIAEVMLVAFDPEGRVTLINRKGCRLLEYETPGELLGRDWFATCLPPGSVDETRAVFRRMMAGEIEAVEYHENPVVTKSGRQKDMAWHNALLRDRDGRIAGALSSGEDITERREAEAALVERERRYRELANDLPTCVFEADLGGRLTFANRTGLDWFGYREAEIADGKTLFDMVVGEERGRAATTLRRTIVDGLVPSGEYTAVRKDRSTFPALVSSRAVVKDGRAVGIRGILIDITERVEAARRIENALAGTIRALAVTTEMRDPYTAGHQERVTELACAIGRELGLSMDRLEGLRVAGTLHDIGKVSVPAEILSKPTSLTPTEFGLVKVHPEAGYEILRAISFPWPVADIVLQHHERVDGTGYPRGLHGDAILLEARILAVADVVEAIVSHRPYRPAQRMERAVEELARGAGTLYDRDVVAACQRLFDRGGLPPME